MLVVGTSTENMNAVWVKNEWKRYLEAMKNDGEKVLIPCFKRMDAYDLPKEFAHLQAQDLNKVGAIQDLVRGINKVIPKGSEQSVSDAISNAFKQENKKRRIRNLVIFGLAGIVASVAIFGG